MPRRLRREVVNRFKEGFDFERLDYDRRVKPLRGKAIMTGVLLAGGVYLTGFSLGYFAWQQQSVDYEIFSKLVWLLMVPSSAVGAFAWLIVGNRLEYTIRQDLRCYIVERETEKGYLWRFGPLYEVLLPDNIIAQRVLEQSREDIEKIDPEDYCRSITLLHKNIQSQGQHTISTEVAEKVYKNFTNEP